LIFGGAASATPEERDYEKSQSSPRLTTTLLSAAVVTPFKDGKLDEKSLQRRGVCHYVDTPIDGRLSMAATTGRSG